MNLVIIESLASAYAPVKLNAECRFRHHGHTGCGLMKLFFHCGRSRRKIVDSLEEGLRWLSPGTNESFSIEVRRKHILVDALKEAKFDLGKLLR